jgi:tellurite resistance protein
MGLPALDGAQDHGASLAIAAARFSKRYCLLANLVKMRGDCWALQHILAAQHGIACWTATSPREIGKGWQFVKTDPELAHGDPQEMRSLLGQNLARLAQNGERDLWRLANAAIGQLRRERSAA